MQYITFVNKPIIIHSQRRLDCSPVHKPAKRTHNLRCRPPYLIFTSRCLYIPVAGSELSNTSTDQPAFDTVQRGRPTLTPLLLTFLLVRLPHYDFVLQSAPVEGEAGNSGIRVMEMIKGYFGFEIFVS